MEVYKEFIAHSVAPSGARRIEVYDEEGRQRGVIPLGSLTPPDRSKRLYSFGAISDPHVGEKPDTFNPKYNYDKNFIAALECLKTDDDVKFVINGGDLFVWVTEKDAQELGTDPVALRKEYMEKYDVLVSDHLPNKTMFVAPGNHEQLSWYRYIEKDGEQKQDWYMVNLLHEYGGWKCSEEGCADVVKTVFLNEKGDVDPNGNDVLVLMACYQYTGGQVGHEYTGKNLIVENVGKENGAYEKTTITVEDEGFVGWNKEWLGKEIEMVDGEETPSIAGYSIKITGVPEWDNGVGYQVVGAVGNVLKIRAKLDDNVAFPIEGVKFSSIFVPQSQLYLAKNNKIVQIPDEDLYEKIGELFTKLKNDGKRVFVLQHVPVTGNYPEGMQTPENIYCLYKSLFYGATVFSGHTHYAFEYKTNGSPRHSLNSSVGFNSVHIPSVHDHAQGYIVDVYENGIHLRGKKFVEVDGKFVAEDVPLGTYWISTKEG